MTYHRVVEKGQSGVLPSNTVFSGDFEKQLQYLVSRYHIATGDEARLVFSGGGKLPNSTVLLTFDDGYENNYTQAFPLLQRYGVTAIFFLTTGLLGKKDATLWFDALDHLLADNGIASVMDCLAAIGLPAEFRNERGVRKWIKSLSRHARDDVLSSLTERLGQGITENNPQLTRLMTWGQVREMAKAGMTFGSHTQSHQILSSATPDELTEELVTSRWKIEREIDCPCWAFAYPNGESADFSASDKAALKAAGYLCAFTQVPGFVDTTADRYALPRIPIPDSDDMRIFASRVSGVHQWFNR